MRPLISAAADSLVAASCWKALKKLPSSHTAHVLSQLAPANPTVHSPRAPATRSTSKPGRRPLMSESQEASFFPLDQETTVGNYMQVLLSVGVCHPFLRHVKPKVDLGIAPKRKPSASHPLGSCSNSTLLVAHPAAQVAALRPARAAPRQHGRRTRARARQCGRSTDN